jgi:hypothetical protein
MPSLRLPGSVVLLALALAGCDGASPPTDSGVIDAGPVDAALPDAGLPDASLPDGGPTDGGPVDGGPPPRRAEILYNADGAFDRYAGIGRSQAGATCTAVLLDVGGADDAPAYALTSGHCTGWWDSNQTFEDRALDGPGEVVFRFFVDTPEAHRSVPVAAAEYSSMMGTDLAVLRLDATVGALRREGIEGLRIADARPSSGASIVNVGAPTTTFVDPIEHLRRGECTLGGEVALAELEWLWPDNVIHDCPDIRTGSSGSPLLDATDAIVAVVHTTASQPAHARCHLGRPCELREGGIESPDARSYAIPVAGLGACFPSGVFDAAAEGCALPRPTGLASQRETLRYVQPGTSSLRVALSSESGITHARARWGLAHETDCTSDDGWGEPFAIAETPVLEVPLPSSDALFVACVRGGRDASSMEPHVVAWLVAVDGTPPALPLPVTYELSGDRATFTVRSENPTYASYLQKSGPSDRTSCADPEGYEFVNIRFGRFTVALTSEPTRVCVVAEDFANNLSAPAEWVLTAGGR